MEENERLDVEDLFHEINKRAKHGEKVFFTNIIILNKN